MKCSQHRLFVLAIICPLFSGVDVERRSGVSYSSADIIAFREEVRKMFYHSYDGYMKFAYPYDELRPLSCDGVDTWGSYSLTLIDALDTLAVMGNFTEFRHVAQLILAQRSNFDSDINVSVFETNIRIVGGLLSAHLLMKKAGMSLSDGWPCRGPLLSLAEDAARRLLPAFDTPHGMPYGTVNLRRGVPNQETPVTCTAGVGTFIVEFGTLSRLTGNPVYERAALRALYSLWKTRSPLGLFGNHINVLTGAWTAMESGIGAGVDSYFEYLVKGASLLDLPDLYEMFRKARVPIESMLNHDGWYFWASMQRGSVTSPIFQSLEAFWPGLLSLVGDISSAMHSIRNYHSVWKKYGYTPEFYSVVTAESSSGRHGYPLRPELAESVFYLYRATKDPEVLQMGVDILRSIQHSAKTECGYATVQNVVSHTLEDRMESFFLAETTKYLYLLFDEDNWIHNPGSHGELHVMPEGQMCILGAGPFIFNTEAHPIDKGALSCCAGQTVDDLLAPLTDEIGKLVNPFTDLSAHRSSAGFPVTHSVSKATLEKIVIPDNPKNPKADELLKFDDLTRKMEAMTTFCPYPRNVEADLIRSGLMHSPSVVGKLVSIEVVKDSFTADQPSPKSTIRKDVIPPGLQVDDLALRNYAPDELGHRGKFGELLSSVVNKFLAEKAAGVPFNLEEFSHKLENFAFQRNQTRLFRSTPLVCPVPNLLEELLLWNNEIPLGM